MARLTFHGAAHEVTGSMHLLEVDGETFALDCGMYQGRRKESAEKNRSFPIAAGDVRGVVLSHAHIDHSGRLPLLVKQGFQKSICCTPATRDLAAVMLEDAAHIQEEDAKYLNKKLARQGEPPAPPLYDQHDAVQTVRQIRTVSYNRWWYLAKNLRVRFYDAGHMLGSAGVHLEILGGARPISLVFSGDIGRKGVPILRDPSPLPDCDYLICESTYGGRTTPEMSEMKERLLGVIHETQAKGGKLIIPAFSVGRTQTIVYYLNQLIQEGSLDALPIYVDSPLAIDATQVFIMHPECYDRDAREFYQETGSLLGCDSCHYTRSVEESKRIHRRRETAVIIAASGMCESGRILHHLKNHCENPNNTILIVGYQAQHTLGRRIVERAESIKIFGDYYRLNARVEVMNGFSSHADANELRELTQPQAANCRKAFLVHGELDQAEALRTTMLRSGYRDVAIPAPGDSFEI